MTEQEFRAYEKFYSAILDRAIKDVTEKHEYGIKKGEWKEIAKDRASALVFLSQDTWLLRLCCNIAKVKQSKIKEILKEYDSRNLYEGVKNETRI